MLKFSTDDYVSAIMIDVVLAEVRCSSRESSRGGGALDEQERHLSIYAEILLDAKTAGRQVFDSCTSREVL